MAQISPFRGIHFDPTRVPLSEVIAPPYDVLSPHQQDALYAKNPANIVRLILNKEEADDAPGHNRYTRAATFLQECLRSGILVQDHEPTYYEYIQKFPHPLDPTHTVERRALFVALTLEPYENGVVLPHEETHPKAKVDRLELMRATHANPEPIYGLYEDPDQSIAKMLMAERINLNPTLQTLVTGWTPQGEEHIIYRHNNPATRHQLERWFADRRVWIADGHHRYETALNYKAESSDPGANALLIGLTAFEDPGLIVLPTHRLVKNISAERLEQLPLQLERFFDLQILSTPDARAWIKQEVLGEKRFALALAGGKAYALTLRDMAQADAALDQSHCPAWRKLDVTLLQTLVLDRSLGISWTALAHTPDVAYTRDEDEAIEKVESGEYQLACLLQNPTVTEVRDVASAGDKMPQKSTFFYPKLWSGLVLRSLV